MCEFLLHVFIKSFVISCMNYYTACPPNSTSQLGAVSCECNANYYEVSNGVCNPCPSNSVSQPGSTGCQCNASSYRAANGSCIPCPPNSASQPGSDSCTCVSGYFRISGEGPSPTCASEICTVESSVYEIYCLDSVYITTIIFPPKFACLHINSLFRDESFCPNFSSSFSVVMPFLSFIRNVK